MAKDTIIDRELAALQGQRWGLRHERGRGREEEADEQGPPAAEDAAAGDTPAEEPASEAQPVRRSRFRAFWSGMFTGDILSRDQARRQFPYMLLLAALALVYITNTFRMQRLHRRHQALTAQLAELRSKSVTMSAELAAMTRRSAVIDLLERRGIELREPLVPAFVIEKE